MAASAPGVYPNAGSAVGRLGEGTRLCCVERCIANLNEGGALLKHVWLYLSNLDIETERLQCLQEGRDLATLEADFERLAALDLEDPQNQPAAQALLDATARLPIRTDYPYREPSDLEGIRAQRPASRPSLPQRDWDEASLLDRVHGAWTGRCAGCLLGKPVEGWHRERLQGLLTAVGRWPLQGYIRYHDLPEAVAQQYGVDAKAAWADLVEGMPEDDDTNYTTVGLAVMKRYGSRFTPQDVAEFWMSEIPILHACTAERVAYRNFCLQIEPPASATFRNPYREWIGAQIRADFWGYAAAGKPERAAELAWRDACISHVKNGIYGEMWAAAMIAAAFVAEDTRLIVEAGLAEIPAQCRLAEAVRDVMDWHASGVGYDDAVDRVHALWNEKRAYDWCHTIPNAMIVTIGLLWSDGEFGSAICRAVQAGFDTDCNGATVGSIMGAVSGSDALPQDWTQILRDTLHTGVAGYHTVRLTDMARSTVDVIRRLY
ncbi:MAG: ADP-ribosylglycohydrolase family protein [Chthonomonadales bacterium]